jgi:hypothetical protein
LVNRAPEASGAEATAGKPPLGRDLFVRETSVVSRRIAGETVILPVRNHVVDVDAIYTLNATGAFVWDLLLGQRSVDELIDAVVAEFDVPRPQAAVDVVRLVHDLRKEQLIRPAASSPDQR